MAGKSPTAVGPPGLLPGGASDRPPLLGRLLQGQEVMIGAIAIALALYFTFSSAHFGTASNGQTLSIYMAPIIYFAVAEVFILILGEIDLAVGEVYVLTPFIVAYMANDGVGVIAGIFIALIVSCMVGFVNGFITVKLRVPSFITTLGTVYALQGIVLITSNAVLGYRIPATMESEVKVAA
ncbi:MAG: ABC transporter permease [Acidimicrobiales bacterium]